MLPKLVDPRRLAEQRVVYKEKIAVSELPRIEDVAESSSSDIDVELVFERDEQHRVRVVGSIKGAIDQVCQRCMGLVETNFDQAVDLLVVWNDDQSKAVPKEIDPWEVGETANLHELIEDEILLALPLVARHEPGECEAPRIPDHESVVEEEQEGRQRPFEILKDLANVSDEK